MALFKNKKTIQLNAQPQVSASEMSNRVPDNFLTPCPICHGKWTDLQLGEAQMCPKCHHHFQFPSPARIEWLVDKGSFEPLPYSKKAENPLDFPGYAEKLTSNRHQLGTEEAVIIGQARLKGQAFALGVMDSRFMMASMGTGVGEALTHLFEWATDKGLPLVLFIASGGARMQEGILSLMQMAKVSQAVAKHHQAGLFYLAVLTHPTTGGVTASFAMQADMILAEPGAVVGFAGQRVIEQTIKAKLAPDFQQAEKVLEYGFIDHIVSRPDQVEMIHFLLEIHSRGGE